ncbi:MAG: type II toxin-antitoxin system YafQ family toxin [Bacteroidales bacterium]|nr:type II toxin-antitoxin system YafQ family toxin [Bacteroidales bacterium]
MVFSSQYKKDLALSIKRKLPVNELDNIIKLLAEDKMLPINYYDHPLSGQLKGCRECHIRPNWLLIYRKSSDNDVEQLSLIRTGTHTDLFGRNRK